MMKFPSSLSYGPTYEIISKLGRTARKTLCRRMGERAEMIADNFGSMSPKLKITTITRLQELADSHLNCSKVTTTLIKTKKMFEEYEPDYKISDEYKELQLKAREAFGDAKEHDDKIETLRMFEILSTLYPDIQEARDDYTLIRALYDNDKTFEKQIIQNEGW